MIYDIPTHASAVPGTRRARPIKAKRLRLLTALTCAAGDNQGIGLPWYASDTARQGQRPSQSDAVVD